MRNWPLAFVLLLTPALGLAHGLDPASLALRETRPGVFEVRWRASTLRLPGANVQPALPARCHQIGAAEAIDESDRVALRWPVDCGAGGLEGEVIGVNDLAAAKINALLTIERLDGKQLQTVLGPRSSSFTVPAQPSRWEVVQSYVTLGIEHILSGPDHLLFVFGLLLLVSAPRLLLQTITAFTLGHCVTLSAAALHFTEVPPRPVEVLIALSVLTLAVELARDVERPTLLRRFPWAMAVAFGLLHGFGFAGALAEAGLPAGAIPLALVSFNLGIEVGQLLFVGTVLTTGALLVRWLPAMVTRSERLAVYTMGVLSAYWCFERVATWLG
ncbi:MAG TPA: HupE/UreJ family protein [Candidatus Nitrosopolaris sp.]|nr:HupE/UreJ family protein [Candidatus Nitrosopolaris sp.]